jgi:predicted PhzF superfamily epimerase YddE/YHI9
MPSYEYLIIDTFASEALAANPATVVLDAIHLNGTPVRSVAREINGSQFEPKPSA